ncbi:hypothetical protein J6590_034402 [Homalodisca vitripennis]|nr:hypothetical protein J6590_034402 [Homalodisca vitripennis]
MSVIVNNRKRIWTTVDVMLRCRAERAEGKLPGRGMTRWRRGGGSVTAHDAGHSTGRVYSARETFRRAGAGAGRCGMNEDDVEESKCSENGGSMNDSGGRSISVVSVEFGAIWRGLAADNERWLKSLRENVPHQCPRPSAVASGESRASTPQFPRPRRLRHDLSPRHFAGPLTKRLAGTIGPTNNYRSG